MRSSSVLCTVSALSSQWCRSDRAVTNGLEDSGQLGALIAICLAVVAYRKRALSRYWLAIIVSFAAPWLPALEEGG